MLGNVVYNVGTMGVAAVWAAGALAAETGVSSAVLYVDMNYNPYQSGNSQ